MPGRTSLACQSVTETRTPYDLLWILPVLSSIVWLTTFLGLFISWYVDGKPMYLHMELNQSFP